MGVGMLPGLPLQQVAEFLQHLDDGVVGRQHMLAGKVLGVLPEHAVVRHRVVHFQTVAATHHEIVVAVTGGGVDRAGTGLGGDVGAENHRYLPLVERMLQQRALQGLAPASCQHFELIPADAGADRLHQFQGRYQQAPPVADQGVLQLRVQAHRQTGRQGPGRGGPDRDGHPVALCRRQ